MGKHKVSKRYLIFIAIIIFWAALYMAGHNVYVSDYLKRIIMEKSAEHLGQDISIDQIHINPIPIFFELEGVSIEDKEEGQWFKAGRIKIYIDLMDLFIKRINVRRVLIQDADLKLTKDSLTIIDIVGKGRSGQSDITFKNIDLRNSRIFYKDDDIKVTGSEVNISAYLKEDPEINFNIGGIDIESKAISVSSISTKGRFHIKGRTFAINSLHLESDGSILDVKGKMYPDTREFDVDARAEVSVSELSKMLGLSVIKNGRIKTAGNIRYLQDELFVKTRVEGKLFLESLMSVLKVEEPLRGFTEFKGIFNVQKGEITGSASAEMTNGHIYGVDIDRVTCNVSYADNKMSFKNGSAELYGGTGKAEVYITLPRVTRYMVDVEVDEVNVSDLLRLINFDVDVSRGKVTGEMKSEGVEFQPEGWFRAQFDNEDGDILKRLDSSEGKFHIKGSIIYLKDLLISNEKSNANVNGEIDLETNKMELRGHLNTTGLSDIVYPYDKKISGSGLAIFSVSGTLGYPVINGGFRASDVFYGGLYYKEAESTFRYEQELLKIYDLSLYLQNETNVFSGDIAFKRAEHLFDLSEPDFDIVAKIKNMKIKRVLNAYGYSVPIDGLVTSTIELDGPLNDLRANAHVSATRVSAYNIPINSVSSEVQFIRGTFLFSDLIISRGDSIVSGELSIDLEGNYKFKTDSVMIHIGQIPIDLNLEKGVVDMELSGKGSLKHPYIISKLKLSDVTAEGVPVGYSEIEIVLKDDEITASGKLFNGKTDLKAGLKLGADLRWELDAQFKRGVYDFIAAYLIKDIPEDLILGLEGRLKMFGDRHNYNGHMKMSSFNLSLYGLNFKNSSDIRIGIFRRKISFEEVHLKSGTASFSVEGSLIPYEKYDLTMYGDSSLAVLKKMFESVNDVKGYGSFVLSVQDKWEDPVINGGISLMNSVVGIKGLTYKIIDINSYIYVDNNRIVVDSLTGNFAGGKIAARGFGQMNELKIEEFHLDTRLEDATIRVSRGIVVNFDGELILKGQHGRSGIVGQVTMKRARYTQRVDWKSQLVKAKTADKPRGTLSRFEKTGLNVKITGSKDIVVNNNIAKATLKVELLLRGTVADPILFGRIETDEGTVYFRNNEFEIINASADFIDSDKINPYFDITAKTSVKGYDIRIVIEGKMPELDLLLTSDPPLDETDILGLLTVGEIGSNLAGMEEGIGTAEATSFLTGKYQDALEERVTILTGLDRFQVEPYVAEESGQIGPRVTASKRLIEDKLFVSYSSSVGYSEGDVVKLEYRLNKSISLIGVQDELGSLGGDIIFRFDFK
jgi:translocation and assembly module TamB